MNAAAVVLLDVRHVRQLVAKSVREHDTSATHLSFRGRDLEDVAEAFDFRGGGVGEFDSGRFRFTTIPGKSLLMVQTHRGDKVNGVEMNPYRTAVPDPDSRLTRPRRDRASSDRYAP